MFKSKLLLRIFVLCMSLLLVLPLNVSTYAYDSEVQLSEEDNSHIVELISPTLEIIETLEKSVGKTQRIEHKISNPIKLSENTRKGINELVLMSHDKTESDVSILSSHTDIYSGVIPTAGESAFLYPIFLDPNEILQVQLDCPNSEYLDYDLYLYQFDMTTGLLIPTPIDYSIYGTYFNNGKTLSENVGTKNSTPYSKAYLIEVYAKQGGSINEEFTVAVSISSTYDVFETDENAFNAYAVTVGTGGSAISSRNLNSPIDNDWYYIDVPSSRNYDAMTFTLDSLSLSNGYDVEVYNVASENKMILVPKSENGSVSLSTGRYYFRVYTNGTYSAGSNYTLTMTPILRPSKILITGYNSVNGPNDYPSYQYGRGYRFKGSYLEVKGVVATSDNYPVANTQVQVEWENPYWSEGSGNRYRTGTAYTNANGEFTVTLEPMPPSTGSISLFLSGAISFMHYYDITGVGAFVVSNPSIYDIDNLIYHFAYSIYVG